MAAAACSGGGESGGQKGGSQAGTGGGTTGTGGNVSGTGSVTGSGGAVSGTGSVTGSGGAVAGTGAAASTGGSTNSGGSGGTATGSGGETGSGGSSNEDCTPTGADEKFSFFITSYHHIQELSGSPDGFGGDLRYNGAATGLEGADAICQEIARRVCFGNKTWKAYLSTSQEDAIDRIGSGPWYDHAGNLVADDVDGLTSGNRPAGGACDDGTYDELGTFHDGSTDVNNDGQDDDDHDTLTASNSNGRYAGFSCDDWTSTTATGGGSGGPVGGGGPMLGHSWPAFSGQGWSQAHPGHGCEAGVNFIQDGPGTGNAVGAGGGYGAFYCFAL